MITCFFLYSFVWVFAAPLCYNILRKSHTALRIGVESLFLAFVLYGAGLLNFWILLIPVFGLELALFIRKRDILRLSSLNQLLALSVVILFHLTLYVIFDFFFSERLDLEIMAWMMKLDQFWKNFTLQMSNEIRFKELLEISWFDYLKFIPTIYFSSFIIGFLGCYWRSRILSRFRCPDFLFWAATLCFALGFLSWDGLWSYLGLQEEMLKGFKSVQDFSANAFVVLSCIYFFQGLSVSSYLMEKFKITRFWQNLWYILIILNLPMVLVILGLVDFLFEFRSPKGSAK